MNWSRRKAFSPSPIGCLHDTYVILLKSDMPWRHYSWDYARWLIIRRSLKEHRRITDRDFSHMGNVGLSSPAGKAPAPSWARVAWSSPALGIATTQSHYPRAVQTCAASASTISGSISGSGGGVSPGPVEVQTIPLLTLYLHGLLTHCQCHPIYIWGSNQSLESLRYHR